VVTLDDVDVYVRSLPGVTVGTSWGNRTWLVGDKGIVWVRPLGKADIKRFGDADVPHGEIIGLRVADLDTKDALLAIAPAGFFTIEHFKGYPAVLIELRLARPAEVRQAILDAWRTRASPALEAKLAAIPSKKAAAKAVAKKSTAKGVAKKSAAKGVAKKSTAKGVAKKAAAKDIAKKSAAKKPATKRGAKTRGSTKKRG
jgi:hypothetical protein